MVVSWIFFSSGGLFLSLCGGVTIWKLLKRRAYRVLRQNRKLKKMTQEQLSEAIKAKREMELLTSLPGWKSIVQIAKHQLQLRENSVLLKPTSNAFEQEYQKGEIQGIKLFLQYPETLLENAKAVIDSTKEPDADLE